MTPLSAPTLLSEHACHGGSQRFYQHDSRVIGLPMRFSLYLPPQARSAHVPALVYLAGLTCTEETFAIKAGAQRLAAELGLALIAPDTSPRGAQVEGESLSWEFGVGAGFYLDAKQAPWAQHWRMESYLMAELLPGLAAGWPIDGSRLGVMGHSMGGHGALTLALRHPSRFHSLSALAPICAPSLCPWGTRAFEGYLGGDRTLWQSHDACELILQRHRAGLGALHSQAILIDQGLADPFLATQLHPHLLQAACEQAGQPLHLRRHEGYDHGYYFISSFIADHLQHHARTLCASDAAALG